MAAVLDPAMLEFASTLAFEDIPIKLRCATCNKLAIGAVKLPCCDQAICEQCSLTPREQCPICEHSPFSADECKPHKSLRMTIKAFLKNEEKKREKEAAAAQQATAQLQVDLQVPETSTTVSEVENTEAVVENGSLSQSGDGDQRVETQLFASDSQQEFREGNADENLAENDYVDPNDDEGEDEDQDDDVVIMTEPPEGENSEQGNATRNDSSHEQNDREAQQDFNSNQMPGFDDNQQMFNAFANMNGFNPMMAMQNAMGGMPGFPMGMPSMMGMPGMNMDPSMMFNGNFGGMGGMNDMNMMGMGMGMNGFGGMPGMAMNGPGFFPGQGGYNNANFGSNMHQNFRNDRGFGGRPYGRGSGRGRGFNNFNRGRGGGFGYQNQSFGSNQGYSNPMQHASQADASDYADQRHQRGEAHLESIKPDDDSPSRPSNFADDDTRLDSTNDSAKHEAVEDGDAAAEDSGVAGNSRDGRENIVGTDVAMLESNGDETRTDNGGDASQVARSTDPNMAYDDSTGVGFSDMRDEQYGYEQQFEAQSYPSHQYGFEGRGRGGFRGGRGGFRGGRGGYGFTNFGSSSEATDLTPVSAPPINAPTGPKAMREGKPNSGRYSRPQPPSAPVSRPSTAIQQGDDGMHRPGHDYVPDEAGTPPRSRSRRSSRRRRSKSPQNEHDSEKEHRRERERRKRREREKSGVDEAGSRRDRSRDASRDRDSSDRRQRDREDDRHAARPARERSREKRRRRRRSRSPRRDADPQSDDEGSSKRRSRHYENGDSHHEEAENSRDANYTRRSSRREVEVDAGEHPHRNARHTRSGTDGDRDRDHDRDRDRDRTRSRRDNGASPTNGVDQPPDDFKIKGSKSGTSNAHASSNPMPPPTSRRERERERERARRERRRAERDHGERDRDRNSDRDRDRERRERSSTPNHSTNTATTTTTKTTTASTDPYAEERERRHAERVLKEQQRRQSSNTGNGSALGKRSSRDYDDGNDDDRDALHAAPRGPRGDTRKNRKERRMNVRYEGEVGSDYDEREAERWR